MSRLLMILISTISLLAVAGCSTYPNKFKCGDAKGLGCTMLADVDKQIESGKIAEVYKEKKQCRGGKCLSLNDAASLTLKRQDQATFDNANPRSSNVYNGYVSDADELDSLLDDDNNLYF